MITITNRQRTIKVDTKQFKADAQKILELLGYPDYDLGILLTTNKTIQRYNRDYRTKDKPTDILSFPYHPDLKAGERIVPESEEDKNLGDILIALEYVKKDAPNWNQTFEQRMRVLLVHGICHLLGYDHILDTDYEVMKKQEELLLKKLK
jgi:rRNA maturation RNase YbeY